MSDLTSNTVAIRKFKESNFFDTGKSYYLLPFKFISLNDQSDLIVNEVGDFLVLKKGIVKDIIRRKFSKNENQELYKDLVANFIISEKEIPDLIDNYAVRYSTKKSFLDSFTTLHIFVMSLRCDHTCHYCQVSRVTADKAKYDLKREHIDKGIQLMMKSPATHVTMEFQGGETLLAFDNIKYAVAHANTAAIENGKTITFVICTNLSLVNEEILNFCKEKDILISTSLDGPKELHDANRHKVEKSSYECTIEGINLAKKIVGKDMVSALMTTSKKSLEYPEEIVDEYYAQGFRNIFLRNISPYGFAIRGDKNKYETEQFITFYKKALDKILDYNYKGKFFVENFARVILQKVLTPFPIGFVDLQSPAGMINNVIVFNYDGAIFATDESRMLAQDTKDMEFNLGHLDNANYENVFYGEKASKYADSWNNETIAGCSECALQSYCGTDLVLNHSMQSDLYGYRPTSTFCQKNMAIIKHVINLYVTDPKAKKAFDSWISEKNYN